MSDTRFTPPFIVRAIITDSSGSGRYEVKTSNGKNYRAIICDRRVHDAWAVKPNRSLPRGKSAWEFVVRQLREHNHVD